MKIYAYTFPSYKEEGKYKIKIGCTKKDDVVIRIRQQITASNPEPFELLYQSDHVKFRDEKIHSILKKYGEHWEGKEWFKTDVDTIKRAINEAKGLSSKPNSFKMREEQQEAVNKAYDYFMTNDGGIYLWNAKMRFGKTFCAYQLMKKIRANKTLILTYKPVTVDGWKDELNNHIDFEGYNFIRALDAKNKITLSKGDVLFASFQDILQDFKVDEENPDRENNTAIKPKFKGLFQEHFDLVIIDEVHFGATNDPAKKFLKNLDYTTTLYLSGTPFKLLNRGDLSDEQIFNWTYMGEQTIKEKLLDKGFDSWEPLDAKFNTYISLPKMTIAGYRIGKDALYDVKYYDYEEKFNFAKFFNSPDGKKFEYNQAVNSFLDTISDKKFDVSPFLAKDIDNLKHTFWLLPNVNSVHALYYALKKHPFFKKYHIIPASGNNLGKGKDTLGLVKNSINEGNKNTITLSCGKLNTGVTVAEWNAIFLLTNTNSMETYFQSIFRAQSPNIEGRKTNCYVFDFDSDRMLKMIYNYAKEHNKNQSISENIKEMIATMKLLCYSDNSFIDLKIDDIMDMAKYGIGAAILQKKFESRYLLNMDVIEDIMSNDAVMKVLESINIFRKVHNKKNEYEISSGLGKGKTFHITKEEYTADEKKRNEVNKTVRQKLQRLLTKLPIFMYLSEYIEERIEDVIENLESNLFEEVTGVKVGDFKMLKDVGAFNIDKLNDAIRAFKLYERKSLSRHQITDTDILDVMANLSNEEVFTPVSIVQEVLDTLPEHVWSDPDLKWLNPAVKNGIWLREVHKRLLKGLKDVIPVWEDRTDHIKNNMLYGYATSNVAWMMACKTMYAWINGPDDKYIRWRESLYIKNIKNKRFLEIEEKDMPNFDLIVGNPPYQENDGGGGQGTSARPLYNLFVEKIIDNINPKYFSFIIPSRWFAGGKGLDPFRKRMQRDKSIKIIRDYPDARKIFPSVEIKGGVCYFLREKEHDGYCMFNNWENDLDKHPVILRDKLSSTIVTKVVENDRFSSLSNIVLPRKPFNLNTNFNDFASKKTGIKCFTKKRRLMHITKDKFKDKHNLLNLYKVFTPFLHTSDFRMRLPHFIGAPGTISAETYIVLSSFKTKIEAANFLTYTNTKFFEFMLRQKAITQIFSKNSFMFVPDQLDYTKEYTDEYLYKKYGLTEKEIEFIESKFR